MNFLFAQRKICALITNKLQKHFRKEKCKDNSHYDAVLAIKVMARDVVVCDFSFVLFHLLMFCARLCVLYLVFCVFYSENLQFLPFFAEKHGGGGEYVINLYICEAKDTFGEEWHVQL